MKDVSKVIIVQGTKIKVTARLVPGHSNVDHLAEDVLALVPGAIGKCTKRNALAYVRSYLTDAWRQIAGRRFSLRDMGPRFELE